MRARPLACALAATLALLASCSGGNTASELAKAPAFEPKGQTKCGVTKSQAKPLIVEWPSSDRAALESQMRRGLVPVRYLGCEMEVLAQCHAPGSYGYAGTERKDDRVVIKDEDDLYANVPLGAVKLEATLKRAGELNVAMTIVGRYEADKTNPKPEELDGTDCAKATHVITAITVGAFDFFAGADASVGGGASVAGAGAGARSAARRDTITRDGNEKACDQASRKDAEPPVGCGAFLRVEVVPIRAPAPVCPDGSTWNGRQCVRTEVVTEVRCPPGTHREEQGCAADVSKRCGAGMHYVEGQGCVPNVAAPGVARTGSTAPAAGEPVETLPADSAFEAESDALRPSEAVTVWLQHAVVLYLAARPDITLLRVEAHTDSVGGSSEKLQRSGRRALAVAHWLVAHGVDCRRLVAAGFGDAKPVQDNATEAGRSKNRRIAFVIAAVDGTPPVYPNGYVMRADGGGTVAGDPCR